MNNLRGPRQEFKDLEEIFKIVDQKYCSFFAEVEGSCELGELPRSKEINAITLEAGKLAQLFCQGPDSESTVDERQGNEVPLPSKKSPFSFFNFHMRKEGAENKYAFPENLFSEWNEKLGASIYQIWFDCLHSSSQGGSDFEILYKQVAAESGKNLSNERLSKIVAVILDEKLPKIIDGRDHTNPILMAVLCKIQELKIESKKFRSKSSCLKTRDSVSP